MAETFLGDLENTRQTHRAEILGLPIGLVEKICLGMIVLMAVFLGFYNLRAVGMGNPYYTAAVKSMLMSWHNFFYVAAEPGGSVTVDKPPLGFWLQAISAYILGINGVAMVLPQVIAGIFSIPLLFALVKRYFGLAAGLLAALALATTPIWIAVMRDNTIDITMIFTLLLAAWAFMKATDSGRLRYLILGGLFVGLGFNIKMLEAFLPLPALFSLYLLGGRASWGRKIANLGLASAVIVTVSLAWPLAVDLTPADQRPYVGSTQGNSEMELIFGYNGISRLLGFFRPGRGGFRSSAAPGNLPGGNPLPGGAFPRSGSGLNGIFPDANGDRRGTANFNRSGLFGGFGDSAPGGDAGRPGLLRLFTNPLAKDIGWLLPFALVGMVFAASLELRKKPLFPLSDYAKGLVLWSVWLLTGAVFLSIAGFVHGYYVSTLAPALAALIAIAAASLSEIAARWPSRAALLLAIGAAAALLLDFTIAVQFPAPWAAVLLGVELAALLCLGIGIALIIWKRHVFKAGLSLAMAGLLLLPGVEAGLTAADPAPNVTLPTSFPAGRFEASIFNRAPAALPAAAIPGSKNEQALIQYLEAGTQGIQYLVAVPSSQVGDPLVLATGRPVLFMGGFLGTDNVVDARQIAQLVQLNRLRYVLDTGQLQIEKPQVYAWLAARCHVASGAPPVQGEGRGGFGPGAARAMLFDCR